MLYLSYVPIKCPTASCVHMSYSSTEPVMLSEAKLKKKSLLLGPYKSKHSTTSDSHPCVN